MASDPRVRPSRDFRDHLLRTTSVLAIAVAAPYIGVIADAGPAADDRAAMLAAQRRVPADHRG